MLCVTIGCGGNLTALQGTFTSPYYPGVEAQNNTCSWLIMVSSLTRHVTVYRYNSIVNSFFAIFYFKLLYGISIRLCAAFLLEIKFLQL